MIYIMLLILLQGGNGKGLLFVVLAGAALGGVYWYYVSFSPWISSYDVCKWNIDDLTVIR